MKRYCLIFFLFCFLCSCQSTSDISKSYEEYPCNDLQYLKLKNKKLSDMTGSESRYFKQMEKECKEFSEEVKPDKSRNDFVIVLIIAGAVAAAAIPLLIFKTH